MTTPLLDVRAFAAGAHVDAGRAASARHLLSASGHRVRAPLHPLVPPADVFGVVGRVRDGAIAGHNIAEPENVARTGSLPFIRSIH